MFKLLGMMFVVPSVMLLTASFFVLIGISIAQEKWVKMFGWFVAIVLWVSCLVLLSSGMMISSSGPERMMGMKHRMMMEDCKMMQGGMKDKMGGHMGKMDMKGKMPADCMKK